MTDHNSHEFDPKVARSTEGKVPEDKASREKGSPDHSTGRDSDTDYFEACGESKHRGERTSDYTGADGPWSDVTKYTRGDPPADRSGYPEYHV